MLKKVKISIIVPVFNVEKYLERCIDSLIKQTFQDIEIILVNDGSTDQSGEICKKYSKKDCRIVYLEKKNGGLSDARNYGLRFAKGNYILFVDSDDWCENEFVFQMFREINASATDVCICGYYIDYTEQGKSIVKNLEDNLYCTKEQIRSCIFNLDNEGMFNIVWNKMYKREIIDKYHLQFEIDAMPGEDLLFNCSYFKYCKSISILSSPLYHYMRQGENTLIIQYKRNLYNQVVRFNKARKDIYYYYDMLEDIYLNLYKKMYVQYIFTCIPNMYRKSGPTFHNRCYLLKEIKNDSEFKQYFREYKGKSLIDKINQQILRINSVYLINFIYTLLFFIRNNFEGFYKKYRLKLISN